jgi:uncharacterized membrane protein YGL010W
MGPRINDTAHRVPASEHAMKSLQTQLSQYASYHRDRRNVWTHFVGIPMIVVALTTLLSPLTWFGIPISIHGHPGLLQLSVATALVLLASIFYLLLDVRYGLVMLLLLALAGAAGEQIVMASGSLWWVSGLGLFVVGWVFQFIGHHFEGRKPAFVDDLVGLLIGPLFIVAEAGFLLGLRRDVESEVVSAAGALR